MRRTPEGRRSLLSSPRGKPVLSSFQAVVAVFAAALLVVSGSTAATAATAATEASSSTSPASTLADTTGTLAKATGTLAEATSAGWREPKTGVAGFSAANIMSDATFYDAKAMTAAQIQTFLDRRISGTCQNGKCINRLKTGVSSKPRVVSQKTGNLVCNALQGGTLSVAEMIYRTQVACGISAKVILVMLQKEQGLVTSTAPSDWNLRAAMGAYCPDTAPCDPAFAGIGPQIYAGVKQLKMYKAGAFAMQPGTHFITYHPDTSRQCGGSNVRVANYATAALYNYTPYQPNAAAIRAGYGEGDRCSSYGNRNFYSYYTDWFGSTQGGAAPASVPNGLVAADRDIFFVSGGVKHYVGPDVYPTYLKAFGASRKVSASALGALTKGPDASRFIRNSSSGAVAYLLDNTSHQFPTCDLVAKWGGSCGSVTNMTSSHFTKFKAGSKMSAFARLKSGGALHRIDGRWLIPVYDGGHAKVLNSGVTPFAPTMPSAVTKKYTVRKAVQFAPGRFIHTKSSGRVYMPAMDGTLIHLPAWGIARDLGLSARVSRVVADSLLNTNARSGALSPVVVCNGKTYIGSQGTLRQVVGASVAGLPTTQLDGPTCGQLSVARGSAISQVFLSPVGKSAVYAVQNGTLRHVSSLALLNEMGGSNPRILKLSPESIAHLPIGSKLSTSLETHQGKLVKTASSSRVSLLTANGRLLYLPSFAIAAEFGLSQKVTVISDAAMRGYRDAGPLSLFAKCGSTTYVASQGKLHPVASSAKEGHRVAGLDGATCAQLKRTDTAAPSRAYIAKQGTSTIYIAAQNGTFRHVTSMSALKRLNGGKVPKVFTVSAATFAALPKGDPVR